MTLAEFLLARIAEDEAEADHVMLEVAMGVSESLAARVLTECAAKRAIVDRSTGMKDHADTLGGPTATLWRAFAGESYFAMVDLAAVYAGHRDYLDAWRP